MSVELLDHMGDDLAIVNAARVSYAKQSAFTWRCEKCRKQWRPVLGPSSRPFCKRADDGIEIWDADCLCGGLGVRSLSDADTGLINYLMKNRHGTPFEMVQFKFRVKVPIFVAREWQRHRIGSFNEVSTRYVEMEPEFYLPPRTDMRTQIGKPGHYQMVPMLDDTSYVASQMMSIAYAEAYTSYKKLLDMGVAREVARNVLPLALLTEFIWSVNLRSLLNFLSLRTHETALLEIRREAREAEKLARTVVPVAMGAWDDNGRIGP